MTSTPSLFIAGDAPLYLFLSPPDTTPRVDWVRGGSSFVNRLLTGSTGNGSKFRAHGPDLSPREHQDLHAIIKLKLIAADEKEPSRLSLHSEQCLEAKPRGHFPSGSIPSGDSESSVYIFQDARAYAQFDEQDTERAIESFNRIRPRYIIYHMLQPLCTGELWNCIRTGPRNSENTNQPERVILVVSAEDLRAEGIELSYGLSWDRTCEDFVAQLGSVGKLVTLATAAHLIVLFGCDGVIYHRGDRISRPRLFFDPLRAEGEFKKQYSGDIPGVAEAFIAGFSKEFAANGNWNMEESIEEGLRTARRLVKNGLALSCTPQDVYNIEEIMGHDSSPQDEKEKLLRFSIPSDVISKGRPEWSILEQVVGQPEEIARLIVTKGIQADSIEVPLARFNRLVLFDRKEIELFRGLSNSLAQYLAAPQHRPLHIGIFGPSGSGKSFAARQVAEAASRGRNVRHLHFDLSQFVDANGLVEAFHEVRDCTLGGYIPLVYFRAFDTDSHPSIVDWLPHLLGPMASGSFSVMGGVARPIGTAVFFFGITGFKTKEDLKKKPMSDFLGRLHGFVNMVGPNQVNEGHGQDGLYPVRRAVVIRTLLEEREEKLRSGQAIEIDNSVLNGLLLTPQYRQGIHSMKSIISMSRLNNCTKFERAALPAESQIDLFVDYQDWAAYMCGVRLPVDIREQLAEKLHDMYQKHIDKAGSDQQKQNLVPWSRLREEFKESSRAHAESIPSKLRLISCFLGLASAQPDRKPVEQLSKLEVEVLAKAEKSRWNEERLAKQWRKGEERSADQRTSPFLIPWDDCTEAVKEIDRAMVAVYPSDKFLPSTYRVYRMKQV
ncbi:hypothetical protein AA0117_g13353 [Alternaria alternata]|uniref:Ryanodine receptor Ryr domain-containing protein n=1 Tax=Alternaria alternata TaxID=5599 RepID=A0A4Q4MLL6_ALTAL|nr:hypothetical protein AA0117_g13353 [Alternaria alternata]